MALHLTAAGDPIRNMVVPRRWPRQVSGERSATGMRLHSLRLLLAVACLASLVAGPSQATPAPPEIKSIVAFVFVPGSGEGEFKPWGTAFFVGVKDPKDEARSFVYLVTAKHVLRTSDGKAWLPKIFVRLNNKKGGADLIAVPLVPSGEDQTVFTHPDDPTADVAIIPALPDEAHFDFKVLPVDSLTSRQDFQNLKITEGSEVFFTGLFSPHTGTRRNYPIVRYGRVALITDEKVKFGDHAADLYLVDTGSYGGNSGSPVFFYLGSDRQPGTLVVGQPVLKLAGVMSGTFLDVQPVRPIETAVIAGAPSNMGIAAVVPAYKIRETLMSPRLSERRGGAEPIAPPDASQRGLPTKPKDSAAGSRR